MRKLQIKQLDGKIWSRIVKTIRFIRDLSFLVLMLALLSTLITAGWGYYKFLRPPKVKPDTLLVMNMDGVVLDAPSLSPLARRLLGEDVQTLRGVVKNIRHRILRAMRRI